MSEETAPAIEAPATEAPVTSDVPEPTLEIPEDLAPEILETEESSEVGAATDETGDGDPFSEYGGKDTIEAATRLYQAAQTEEGIIQLFLEAGTRLGVGLDRIQALFGADAGTDDAADDEDLDRSLTIREFQELQAKQEAERKAKETEAARAGAQKVIQSTLGELGVDLDDPSAEVILKMGDRYLKGDLSSEAVAAAVRRGHADYIAQIEKQHQAYLAKKRQAAKVPAGLSGSAAPSASQPDEPKDVAEAARRVREMLRG